SGPVELRCNYSFDDRQRVPTNNLLEQVIAFALIRLAEVGAQQEVCLFLGFGCHTHRKVCLSNLRIILGRSRAEVYFDNRARMANFVQMIVQCLLAYTSTFLSEAVRRRGPR